MNVPHLAGGIQSARELVRVGLAIHLMICLYVSFNNRHTWSLIATVYIATGDS
jgi:hypothetical protein